MTIILPLLAFLFATAVVAFVGLRFSTNRGTIIERRLQEVAGGELRESAEIRATQIKEYLKKLGARAPQSPGEMGKLRLRLVQAGYRGPEALPIFLGLRMAIAIGTFMLLATPLLIRPNLMVGVGGALLGYVLPGIVLARMARARQHRLQLALPDALDLLVVSVEAGLGLDQALLRVGEELVHAHPDLADELKLVNLELRAGKARADALRNLGDRTGLDDIHSLVTVLVQTDKFGTSVAQSLRVHSDVLRTKRRQRAEEAAAKTGVKMVFPLVFCIFPAIWVVTIGPAAIKFVQVLFPMADRMK
ncbi:MAG TPA: type II secretion system F family protein [Vicinamibacterales bacterium]|nr:type II secretion system F family protein [Vicinamibacterales bacterium]